MIFVHVLADVDVLGVFPPLFGLGWQNDASRLAMPRDLSRWWRTSCTCTGPGRCGRLAVILELREMSLDLDLIGLLGFVDRIVACSGSARKSAEAVDRTPGHLCSKAEQRHLLVIVKGTEDFIRKVQDVHGEAIAVETTMLLCTVLHLKISFRLRARMLHQDSSAISTSPIAGQCLIKRRSSSAAISNNGAGER